MKKRFEKGLWRKSAAERVGGDYLREGITVDLSGSSHRRQRGKKISLSWLRRAR